MTAEQRYLVVALPRALVREQQIIAQDTFMRLVDLQEAWANAFMRLWLPNSNVVALVWTFLFAFRDRDDAEYAQWFRERLAFGHP